MIDWKSQKSNTLVCYCKQVNKGTILQAIHNGALSLQEIQRVTKAGLGAQCFELNPQKRCCHTDIEILLKQHK